MSDLQAVFQGFEGPAENWTKLPLSIIEALPLFQSLAELKVVIYVLRHTWGYQEYDEPKRITMDEFQNGRKRRDGSRVDNGVGMAESSIRDGIDKAAAHHFLNVEIDDSDKARVKKYYSLVGVENTPPEVAKSPPGVLETLPRTEIDTSDRNLRDKTLAASAAGESNPVQINPALKEEFKSAPPVANTPPRLTLEDRAWYLVHRDQKVILVPGYSDVYQSMKQQQQLGAGWSGYQGSALKGSAFADYRRVDVLDMGRDNLLDPLSVGKPANIDAETLSSPDPTPALALLPAVSSAAASDPDATLPMLPPGVRWGYMAPGIATRHAFRGKGKSLCGQFSWGAYLMPMPSASVNYTTCPECAEALKAKPPAPPPKPKDTRYGDLFVLVHKYAFNSALNDFMKDRAGKCTKSLIKAFPDIKPDEFERFAKGWKVGLDFPSGEQSLPKSYGLWRSQGSSTTQPPREKVPVVVADETGRGKTVWR